jgi:hypothetical protein
MAGEADAQRASYRAFLGSYNSKRNDNHVMIELYVGQPLWNEARDLHDQMRTIGQELECDYKTRKAADLETAAEA